MKQTKLQFISWALGIVVVVLAIAVWAGERFGSNLTIYSIFPLLGLIAFSIMWTHYITGSVRRIFGLKARENKVYLKYSSIVVLALILLHPGLLIFQLQRDGFGLPPKSYLTVYSEPTMKFALLLGSISLTIFLAFELKRKFSKKSWWKFVDAAQILAMGLIFFHGLSLGRELSVGWYKAVWYVYGLSFIAAVFYNYWYDKKANKGGV